MELGELLTDRLTRLFKNGIVTSPGNTRLSGQVVIVKISEMPVHDTGVIRSEMTVAVKDLTHANGEDIRTIPALSVTVSGEGLGKAMLSKAASALSEDIINALIQKRSVKRHRPSQPLETHDKTIDTKDKKDSRGFE